MADVLIDDKHLEDIADAIRGKNGSEDLYKPREMAAAIEALESANPDCNGMHVPEEALVISGNCSYLFSNNQFVWFIEQCGDKIKTEDITTSTNMFQTSVNLTEIPFDINILIKQYPSVQNILGNFCIGCTKLNSFPMVNLKSSSADSSKHLVLLEFGSDFFRYVTPPEEPFITKDEYVTIAGIGYNSFIYSKFEQEPTWLFDLIDWDAARNNKKFGSSFPVSWNYSHYIKKIPSFPKFWNNETSSYNHYSYMNFNQCNSLQEIVLPRPGSGVLTSSPSGFSRFGYCSTLKKIVFDVQPDGTPYAADWKNVALNITGAINNDINGNVLSSDIIDRLNPDKCVTDEESYQRLKNDAEYWICIPEITNDSSSPLYQKQSYYSAWNHDAALELIKSMPDTSAYIAANGGTNTLKMRGVSGEGTDGGAINTLTPEEIAIATQKGWTVSFA